MNQPHEITPEQREDLVAYLDGELSEAATQEIESTLVREPGIRQEVDLLARTWDLLDVLPQKPASGHFTAKTMASIAVERPPETPAERRRKWIRRGVTGLAWAGGVFLAAAIGFLSANRWIQTDADLLVEKLPLVQEIDVYQEIDDAEFLIQLRNSGLFDDASKPNQP
jgi:anti-sigma factor RsiW